MKILHITEMLKGASGVVTFVRELNSGLIKRGIESTVSTTNNIDKILLDKKPNIIHIHGLWIWINHKATYLARRNNIPVVWSTHGMTSPWSMRHKWWKKLPAWYLYQKHDMKYASLIHCTTELELKWNRQLGFENCFIAPLGTNEKRCKLITNQGENTEKILLFVGRIYPVKGLINLIKAWKEIFSKNTNIKNITEKWKLRIVGPDEAGHEIELKKLISDLNIQDSIEFTGSKYGDELSKEYSNCDCLILPSFTENFGATVIDALAHGKPCITSTFTPWQELEERKCGWWVSNEPDVLAKTIYEMMVIGNDARNEMGTRGYALVQEKYTWDVIIDKMINEYKYIIDK